MCSYGAKEQRRKALDEQRLLLLHSGPGGCRAARVAAPAYGPLASRVRRWRDGLRSRPAAGLEGRAIWERAKRASKTVAASGKVGMKGTSSSRFEGKCVNTIVLSSPIRAAMRSASRYETRRHHVRPKKEWADGFRPGAEAKRDQGSACFCCKNSR